MSTLFISDLHLDDTRPEITQLFLNFLAKTASNAEALYILGDLFEAWVGDDETSTIAKQVRKALREVSEQGVPIFFMRGNRDFLVSAQFASDCGLTLLPDPCVIDLYGKPTLLMHGDLLCTDDTAYQAFRNQVRHPDWQAQFLSQSLDARLAFAAQARKASQAHQSALQETIMDVNQNSLDSLMLHYGITRLIHGHTHRPNIHGFVLNNIPYQRIVLGDWYTQGSMLEVNTDGVALVDLKFDT
jgi:UDP-2,3-diacylglucosamine hydrolase